MTEENLKCLLRSISSKNGTTFVSQNSATGLLSFQLFAECCLKKKRCYPMANYQLFEMVSDDTQEEAPDIMKKRLMH